MKTDPDRSYGTAILADKNGHAVVYQLCRPQAHDPATILVNFKPRRFDKIVAMDHDGSGAHYVYIPEVVDEGDLSMNIELDEKEATLLVVGLENIIVTLERGEAARWRASADPLPNQMAIKASCRSLQDRIQSTYRLTLPTPVETA